MTLISVTHVAEGGMSLKRAEYFGPILCMRIGKK